MGKHPPIAPSPLDTLIQLKEWVPSLNPPVFAFENRITRSPFQVLISVLLSSRTKDETTEGAVERLFSRADTADEMSRLEEKEIAGLIYPVGFYREKARNIKAICRTLAGNRPVPNDFPRLTLLPGVGPKTANLVLALAFGIPAVAVDTHVFRISRRLGWAEGDTPEKVGEELRRRFPEEYWNSINQTLVGFGQTICRPLSPRCRDCRISLFCPDFRKRKAAP